MSNKEIEGINVFMTSVSRIEGILGLHTNDSTFDNKPSVHVTHDFFEKHFKVYERKPFTIDLDYLYTEQNGVVWLCIIRRQV